MFEHYIKCAGALRLLRQAGALLARFYEPLDLQGGRRIVVKVCRKMTFYRIRNRLPTEKVPLGPETPKTKKKIFLKGALLGRRGLKVRFFAYF